MGKVFLVIIYIYAIWHFWAYGGRTAEIVQDSSGNAIQQLYDRDGNMIGVYDEKGIQLKETQYTNEGDIISEKVYENGRLIKEVEYEPYMKTDTSSFVPERTEMFEYNYTPDSKNVEIVLTVTDGGITATDSVVHQMQSGYNYIMPGAFGTSGSGDIGKMTAYIHSITEYGTDYNIKVKYDANGAVTDIVDSRDQEKEDN